MSEHGHHIIPYKVYYTVFGALIFLTAFTVFTASFDLGGFNVPLALTIAGGKASLVVMFFMALKYDSKVNIMVFSVGILFVLIFIGFTMLDTEFRGAFDETKGSTIVDQQMVIDREEALNQEVDRMLAPAVADSTSE